MYIYKYLCKYVKKNGIIVIKNIYIYWQNIANIAIVNVQKYV